MTTLRFSYAGARHLQLLAKCAKRFGYLAIVAAIFPQPAYAQPSKVPVKPETHFREVVSPLPVREIVLPAPTCGTTSVVRPDGTTIDIPSRGVFVERCMNVRVVDGAKVISSFERCEPLQFKNC